MVEDLRRMGEERLLALVREIEAILTERRGGEVGEGAGGEGGRWLRFEYTKCGKCSRCADGRYVHGPYWYLYEYTGGKMKSTYVGRRVTDGVASAHGAPGLAGKRPEDVYPREVERLRAGAGGCATALRQPRRSGGSR